MIRNLKPPLRFSCNGGHTVLANFRSEQLSDDYVSSLCKQNLFEKAIEAFECLQKREGFQIKLSTYAHLICACASLRNLEHGRKVHYHLKTASNSKPDVILLNHILNMYGKCGSLKDARKVFDEILEPNLVSWTSMIAGYSQNGRAHEAVELYFQMLRWSGLRPDQFTFGSIIRACSSLGNVGLGRQLHAHVTKSEYGSHLIAQNALIAMYTKFDHVVDAMEVFSRIATKDLISWSSIIAGLSQLGYELEALSHFREMLCQGIYQPNQFIFGSVFSACGSLLQPEYGQQIHGVSVKFGLGRDVFCGCSLSDMYAKCNILDSSKTVFYQIERPDLVSWNAIIAGFAYAGDTNEAISLFLQMRHLQLVPDEITVRTLLCAFTSPCTLYQGKQIHSYITKMGFDLDVSVCNTLLTMYTKCSDLGEAFNMFNETRSNADSVSWNAILTACMQHKQAIEVFRLFKLMHITQNKPDNITLSNLLGACAEISSLEMGNQVHCHAIQNGLEFDISVTNGLIDMYTKCGSLVSARKLFDSMENSNVVSWSSLIVGYAQFGYGEEALNLFGTMISLGIKPNEVTLIGVLTACSHVGRVEEGWQLYKMMEIEHGIVPTREHCSCMVDLLARAGRLNEAEAFISQMTFDPDIVVWKTLLAACKTHGNAQIGKQAAENILKIDPSNSAAHILLCNIYASSGRWEDVARLRSLMKQRGVRKVPGWSWIEVKDRIHIFLAEDCSHPERNKIYTILEELWLQILDAGKEASTEPL
ncbi:pentatricopeptide repeat-containing protein At3g53360, mitochondrial isoform X1 [Malania oleifera]|uniref:pentatricopeptide repeat-containing protein At3g53360, mitochondrial isoform X1 n=1 Tax=Malania oleifera TaxID=397392 RepID=UPI0025AE1B7C|nr:pentatricopeptide repeat-containing protein At3g53360, mitochondrial isoform X1 [Malania oleifera]